MAVPKRFKFKIKKQNSLLLKKQSHYIKSGDKVCTYYFFRFKS